MATLRENASIGELQDYVAGVERERGFANESVLQKCLLLGEEVGELFKAVRKTAGIGVDPTSAVGNVSDELADVLIFVIAIANRYGVNLEAAVRGKDAKSRDRTWS
jgi:NTP pyrophosphatase (non-canonical NTP hydrolase)